MAETRPVKICEAEEDACKKDVQALCYHCSRNLCRTHLVRHAQLMEDKTKAELNVLTDQFNELSARFNDLSFSESILENPRLQLERWSIEAHQTIDQIVENKRKELQDEFEKHRQVFLHGKKEQSVKLNGSKKTLRELIEESDATTSQITSLQQSIEETQTYLNNQTIPVFNLVVQPANWFVNIRTEGQAESKDKIREFQITYVRVNGLIRNYFIRTKENGTMADLMKNFIRQYTVIEEATLLENNQIYTIDHLPDSDFLLPVEVYNHRIHLQYQENSLLKDITNRDLIVFYETPYSVHDLNNPHILMPCLFRNPTTGQSFGLPIYLSVPRKECRGAHIREALQRTVDKFYTPITAIGPSCYKAFLRRTVGSSATEVKLDDALQDQIDFTNVFTWAIVDFDNKSIDTTDWTYFNDRRF